MREKTRPTSLATALLLFGPASWAPALAGTYQETGGPTPVTPTSGYTWYNPTAITIADGGADYVYVYMQGGPNDSEPCDIDQNPATTNGPAVTGDAIYAMRAPLNPLTKLPGEFSRVGRISPCVPPPPGVPSIPPNIHAFFGPGQVFKSRIEGVDKYYLLADASNSALFREIWLGSSTDGKSWTWSVSSISQSTTEVYGRPGEVLRSIQSNPAPPLVTSEQLAGFYLLNPILVAKNLGQANEYWWGFFNFRTSDLVEKIGQMKVARNGGQWQASILTATSPYQYSQLAGGNQLNVQPASVKSGAAKSLVWSTVENSFELWGGSASLNNSTPYSVDPGVAGCNTNLTAQCLEPPHAPNPLNGCETCTTGDNSCVDYLATVNAYLYNTGVTGPVASGHGMTFVWWRVSESSFDATDRLVSSTARSMPGGNEFSRQFPARWDAPDVQGTRYLFSATNDTNLCMGLLFSPYYKMYVVQTKLEYTPSPSTQSLAVTKSGTGTGTVTSSPAGISCGSNCQHDFSAGQVVALTPQWSAGSNFAGWSGDADCEDGSVTMSASRSCTATFNTTFGLARTLTLTKSGTGSGSVTSHPTGVNCGSDCSQSYPSGTVVVLIAQAAAGSTFAGWTGVADCLDGKVTMSTNRSCGAVFNTTSSTASLSVSKAGTGTGTVTSIPGGISCGSDCQENYSVGQTVVLKFQASAGSAFSSWGQDPDCVDGNLQMSANRSCTATFTSNPSATAHVAWVQPGNQLGWGPPNGLVIAGTALGAPAGTPVLLRWRNASTSGQWVIDTYPPTPDPVTGAWYHSIDPANFNQQYDIYVSYGSIASPICTYQGLNALTTCP